MYFVIPVVAVFIVRLYQMKRPYNQHASVSEGWVKCWTLTGFGWVAAVTVSRIRPSMDMCFRYTSTGG